MSLKIADKIGHQKIIKIGAILYAIITYTSSFMTTFFSFSVFYVMIPSKTILSSLFYFSIR
jgi:hypothetical protein